MMKTNIKDMKILEVETKDFVDINDFLRKNYFQLFFNRRNILTLLYVFQEGKESFFIKKSQVYINVHMEFIDNREGVSYLKRDYIDYEEGVVSVEIQPLNYYIDYEWEAK